MSKFRQELVFVGIADHLDRRQGDAHSAAREFASMSVACQSQPCFIEGA